MKSLAEKISEARYKLGISQTILGDKVGVSLRSILAYEKGESTPRMNVIYKLAKELGVSVKYLTDENCENPFEDIEKDGHIEEVHGRYGAKGARDLDTIINENCALFAGGDLSFEEKEIFFEALTKAYIACKEEAREKFTPKSKKLENK